MSRFDDIDDVPFGPEEDDEPLLAPARRQKTKEPFIMIPKWLIESPKLSPDIAGGPRRLCRSFRHV